MMSFYTFFVYLLKYFHATKEREAKFYLTLYGLECLSAVVIVWVYIVKMSFMTGD